jgi:hypothetical protein
MKPIYRVVQPGDVEGRTETTVAYLSDMKLAQILKRSGYGSGCAGTGHGRIVTEKVYESFEDLTVFMQRAITEQRTREEALRVSMAARSCSGPAEAIEKLLGQMPALERNELLHRLAQRHGTDTEIRTDVDEV